MHFFIPLLLIVQTTGLFPTAVETGRYDVPQVPEQRIKAHRARIKWDEVNNVEYFSLKLLKGAEGKQLVKKYEVNGSKHKKTIKELTPDTTYHVRLKAYYQNGGESRYSKKVSFTTDAEANPTTDVQLGINFLVLEGDHAANADQYTDFTALGIDALRQLSTVDLTWSQLEPQDNQWIFTDSDAIIPTLEFEPIVTLFRYQYASGTPPWATATDDFQKTVGTEAADYVATVVDRYKDDVTYWEIGNEMDHWIALDGSLETSLATTDPPSYTDGESFTPEEQGLFLAQVAEIIREHDPNAVIVLPGMGGLNDHTLGSWLPGVVSGGGTDWFDIVNYHYYIEWTRYPSAREELNTTMDTLGISDKPVWLTETGSSSDPTLTIRTDYPNSDTTQASDVFRRLIPAYASGDTLAIWHTYQGNDSSDNDFRYYGIIEADGTPKLAYYSLQLLAETLLPFSEVTKESDYIYRITKTNQATAYVAWSATTATWTVPDGITEYTSVIADEQGTFEWQPIEAGNSIAISSVPILAR